MANVNHWMEWKKTCALGLCEPDAQADLQAFVLARFRRYTSEYEPSSMTGGEYEPRDAWHLFETYFQLSRGREGKCYKAWLFVRGSASSSGPAALQAIESGASLLLRDVVRERLRRERPHPQTQPLDEPYSSKSGMLTVEDLLPCSVDTAGEVEKRDLEALANQLADGMLNDLTDRERMAMLAREQGISCAHPDMLKAAGCGKSALADAHPTALKKIAGRARKACPEESRDVLAALAVALFDAVRCRLLASANMESSVSRKGAKSAKQTTSQSCPSLCDPGVLARKYP